MALRPWRVVSSPWSASCRLTSAVDDMAAAVPSSTALWPGCPSHINSRISGGATAIICRAPAISTVLRASQKCPRENSSPTMNNSSATPSSDRKLSVSPGAITPMTEGPSTTPTERYPSKAGTLNAAVAIAARLQAASRINVAPSKPCIGQRPSCADTQRTMSCVPIAPA